MLVAAIGIHIGIAMTRRIPVYNCLMMDGLILPKHAAAIKIEIKSEYCCVDGRHNSYIRIYIYIYIANKSNHPN
jgi:hypothetical protein